MLYNGSAKYTNSFEPDDNDRLLEKFKKLAFSLEQKVVSNI